jgi:putative hydrolase of the HAD superfamily
MQALVFDLDGTLLQYTREYREVLTGSFEAVCGDVEESWIETYTEAFLEEFGECNPEPARRAFERTAAPANPQRFAEQLHQAEVDATRSAPRAHEDLDDLGEAFSLAVLTNGPTDWQLGKLDAHGLTDPFDAIVTSYEVGAHKPDTEPFAAVERRLDADAYAMIGDSDSDVEGARAAGWRAHQYDGGRLAAAPAAVSWER